MWYVVQVYTGSEENIRAQCERNLPQAMKHCFIPYYEEKRRIRGQWILQQKILFPGYVFMVTKELEYELAVLCEELRRVVGLTKLIGTGKEIVPLTDQEVGFLQSFGGDEQIVRMSEGIIENTQVKVTSGPLIGKEGYIRKIDRHKRKAYLEIEMFGRLQQIQVGLEIVAKM